MFHLQQNQNRKTFQFVILLFLLVNGFCFLCPLHAKEGVPGYAFIRHIEGRGLSYRKGYTTVGLLLTPCKLKPCRLQPFLDLRGHALNVGKSCANAGLGLRYLNGRGIVFGVNTYYDFRDDNDSCHQIGVGAELLTCFFDFRINGYFPVGTKRHLGRHNRYTYEGGFFATCSKEKKSSRGGDIEIGTSLSRWRCNDSCSLCWDPFIAIGGYYYDDDCCSCEKVRGGKFRAGIRWSDWLTLEGRVSTDSVFKTRGQGVITLTLPLALLFDPRCPRDYCPSPCSYQQQPVHRQEIIVLQKGCTWGERNF